MNYSNDFIEQVVENVIRELGSRPASGDSAQPAASVAATEDAVITSRVITEDVLLAGGVGCGTIVIPAGAVITPSGREFIRRHSITIARAADPANAAAGCQAGGGLVVMGTRSSGLATAASASGWDTAQADCAAGLAEQAAASAACGRRAVTCCHHPSVTACLINRCEARRAAVLTPQFCLTRLLRHMNPDVVCISPEGWSFSKYVTLLKQLGSGDLTAPDGWKELSE